MNYFGNIVAKVILGNDMDYMFSLQDKRPGICSVCHNLIEQIPDLDAVIKRKKGDFFVTYDGFALVSQKFKDFCESRNYPHLTFQEMTNMKGLYYFMPNEVFQIDTSVLHFMNYNECCRSFDGVYGGLIKIAPNFPIVSNDFICRSNIFFRDRQKKGPLYIIGIETVQHMCDYGLKDICFDNVYQ